MTSRERIEAVFSRERPDRTPVLGGWIANPDHICSLTGIDLDTYWSNPESYSLDAYRELGVDGLLGNFVPKKRGDFRGVDAETCFSARSDMGPEDAMEFVERLPEPSQIIESFDLEAEYAAFSEDLLRRQAESREIVWLPPQWTIAAKATWYDELGYENYFLILGAYPEHARKLMEVGGARGYCQSLVLARAVSRGIYPKAVLFGEDICTQRGPMVSPEFLGSFYAPQLARGLEPLLDVGCNPVWHSDGDIRGIMDMLLECGVQGFQGFQPECGMMIEEIVQRRTRDGRKLIIFGPLSVTVELPQMTPDQVRLRVREVISLCSDKAHLALFTANTINPDVPLANIVAMCEAVRECEA